MSLADRLAKADAQPGRQGGCTTCRWLKELTPQDRAAFYQWIDDGLSGSQLWEVASTDPDHPLKTGVSQMRLHLRTCKREP